MSDPSTYDESPGALSSITDPVAAKEIGKLWRMVESRVGATDPKAGHVFVTQADLASLRKDLTARLDKIPLAPPAQSSLRGTTGGGGKPAAAMTLALAANKPLYLNWPNTDAGIYFDATTRQIRFLLNKIDSFTFDASAISNNGSTLRFLDGSLVHENGGGQRVFTLDASGGFGVHYPTLGAPGNAAAPAGYWTIVLGGSLAHIPYYL